MFAPSTPSGSFAAAAAETILPLAEDRGCLLIAGDLSANEETRRLVLSLLDNFQGLKLVLGATVVELAARGRPLANLHLFATEAELRAAAKAAGQKSAAGTAPDAAGQLLDELEPGGSLTVCAGRIIWTKLDGQICATEAREPAEPGKLAANCAVYLLNNPRQSWKALVSGSWQARGAAER